MTLTLTRRALSAGAMLLAAAALPLSPATAQDDLEGGTLRVGILDDIANFDPHQFSAVNFPILKNLYDNLIEYTAEGEAIPNLVASWEISEDSDSITLTLRDDVVFHSGAPMDAESVATNLEKANDPVAGKNVYPTMSVVEGWEVTGPHEIRVDFTQSLPEKQITDLLQFIAIIDPAVIDEVETTPGGTGPFVLDSREVGQEIRMVANENYWREGEPVSNELVITVFSDDAAATAALESGAIDMIYGGTARSAVRLRDSGYQLIQGPGPLVQVFRINVTQPPFDNAEFRRAFNYLMNRPGILRVGYAGLGVPVALPWAPVSPAFDESYNEEFAYNLDKAREHLDASGLSEEEMEDWSLLVNGGDQPSTLISQVVQSSLQEAGIDIELDLKQGSEFVDAILSGEFAAVFAGIGNVQKFPTRVTTNSIYRTQNNPVFGDPHPFPEYVEAIRQVDTTLGPPEAIQEAYDNLNRTLVDVAFAIPTNTYDRGLLVAAPDVGGFIRDIDNLFVARTLGFRP